MENIVFKDFTDDRYDFIGEFSGCPVRAIVKNKKGLLGFIDEKGNEVIPCKYQYAEKFSEDLAMVFFRDENLVTTIQYINYDGEVVIDLGTTYKFAGSFNNGKALVYKDYLYGYINNKGEIAFDLKYYFATNFSEGYAVVNEVSSGNPSYNKIIDNHGKKLELDDNIFVNSDSIFKNGFAKVSMHFGRPYSPETWKPCYIDKMGKIYSRPEEKEQLKKYCEYASVPAFLKYGQIYKDEIKDYCSNFQIAGKWYTLRASTPEALEMKKEEIINELSHFEIEMENMQKVLRNLI